MNKLIKDLIKDEVKNFKENQAKERQELDENKAQKLGDNSQSLSITKTNDDQVAYTKIADLYNDIITKTQLTSNSQQIITDILSPQVERMIYQPNRLVGKVKRFNMSALTEIIPVQKTGSSVSETPENTAINESTGLTFSEIKLEAVAVAGFVQASDRVLRGTKISPSLAELITQDLTTQIVRKLENNILNGEGGDDKMSGLKSLLNADSTKTSLKQLKSASSTKNKVTKADLDNLINSVPPEFRANSSLIMSDLVFKAIRDLDTGSSNFRLFESNEGNRDALANGYYRSHPCYVSEFVSNDYTILDITAESAGLVLFADLNNAFILGTNGAIEVKHDELFDMKKMNSGFRAVQYADVKPFRINAMSVLGYLSK